MIDAPPVASRSRQLLVVAATAVVLLGLVAVVGGRGPDPLERAKAELADEQAFTGARSAGEALLRASRHLQDGGTDCDDGRARCDRLLSAAAMARVSAVDILECRRPDIFAFRLRFERYLAALAEGGDPVPPPPPTCS